MSDYIPEFTEEQSHQFLHGRCPILSPSPQMPFSGLSPEIEETTHFIADSMVIFYGLGSYNESQISYKEPLLDDVTSEICENLPSVEYVEETSRALVPTHIDEISLPRARQRRGRRPFTFQEVKTLIGAVEMFGKQRWSDIEIYFFPNANHRTRTDLKDEWSTLIRTALKPASRRKSDLPEWLLEKALAVDADWFQG